MQEIGLPTYWVAVISNEHVKSSTVVKWLCRRNSTESVMMSCRFRYLLSPPSSLYMIAPVLYCYRGRRPPTTEDNDDEDASQRDEGKPPLIAADRCRSRRHHRLLHLFPLTPPITHVRINPRPRERGAARSPPLLTEDYESLDGGLRTTRTYHQPALTSVAHPPRSRTNESSKTKRERDTSVHGCPRGVPLYLPPFFSSFRLAFSPVPLPLRLPLLLPPLSLSLFLSLLPCPSFTVSLSLSLSPSNPLSPPGVLPSLDSPYGDRSPNHAGRVPDESSTCSSSSCGRQRSAAHARPRESFSERVNKSAVAGEGRGRGSTRGAGRVLFSLLPFPCSPSFYYLRRASAASSQSCGTAYCSLSLSLSSSSRFFNNYPFPQSPR